MYLEVLIDVGGVPILHVRQLIRLHDGIFIELSCRDEVDNCSLEHAHALSKRSQVSASSLLELFFELLECRGPQT